MPRNVDSPNAVQLQSRQIAIAFFVSLQFKSTTSYLTTLPFNVTWNGHTWAGVGDLGSIGQITEGTDVNAYGTSLTLSGIDASLLTESLDDIQLGAPAKIWMVLFDNQGNIIGQPTVLFGGLVDKPSISGGPDTVSITINVESPLINLGRGQFRRLTNADQHIDHPTDTSMSWVSLLNFLALIASALSQRCDLNKPCEFGETPNALSEQWTIPSQAA